METRDPEPGQQVLVSQDGGGPWMETDEPAPPVPAPISRYQSVMDDDGVDDVFLPPPPPSYMAPLMPAEGSTEAIGASNPSVTLINVAADATEAKANPSGLDWHHGEKQFMAVQEAKAIKPEESTNRESTLSYNQDQTSMEDVGTLLETCADQTLDTTGDEGSNADSEDSVTLGGRLEDWREPGAERDDYSEQLPENSGYGTDSDKEGDISGDNDRDFDSWESSEPVKYNQNWTEEADDQPEVTTEMSDYDVDTRSFNYNLTKCDWVRRESGASETREGRVSISEGSEETVMKGKQGDGSRQIVTDIQQGEQLLQRLQQVQLRQDVCVPESHRNTQQTAEEMTEEDDGGHGTAREKNATTRIEREESLLPTDDSKGGLVNQMERQEIETNESGDAKGRMSLSTPVEPEHEIVARIEAGDSEDEENDSWVSADLSPISFHETTSSHIPFPSTHHRFSASETAIERQMQEALQEKQNLQRAGGLFNLADNPDVLEIPFKTSISLEPLTATDPQSCQLGDSPFSEQKMHKEISLEIQRELVLVNLGTIPGEYSRGEVHQLKDTKLLFEAFQQDKTEGPTRHRRSPTLLIKGPVYQSVLERTRSLEMVSLQSHPIPRTHSLRLPKSTSEMEKCLEGLRAKSSNASFRGKTHLLPNPKPGKIPCLNRSMDSIHKKRPDMETVRKTGEAKSIQGSPIIKQNPFCKLRPALALQPEVEKDIREAKEREEELRRQRCTLYGENRSKSDDGEKSQFTPHDPDVRQQSMGKLERVWPPPSKNDQTNADTTQQEPKVHRAGGQKAALWERWESGLINGQTPKKKK